MTGLVGSHCHLDFDSLLPEVDQVVARAAEAGVERMVTICTKLRNEPAVRAIAEAQTAAVRAEIAIESCLGHPPEFDNAPLSGDGTWTQD